MKNSAVGVIAVGAAIAGVLFASSCLSTNSKGLDKNFSVFSEDGLAFIGSKSQNVDPSCFYHGTKATYPVEDIIKKDRSYQFIGLEVAQGGLPVQLELDTGSATYASLMKELMVDPAYGVLVQRDPKAASKNVANSVLKIFSNANRSEFNVVPWSGIPGGTGTKNPLNVELDFFSQVYFLVTDSDSTFAAKNAHRIAKGNSKYLSPYYAPILRSTNKKAITFRYFSNHNQITKRDCSYVYELELEVERAGGGGNFMAPIIIDPDETNSGTTRNGRP